MSTLQASRQAGSLHPQSSSQWRRTEWPCPASSTAASTMSRSAPAAPSRRGAAPISFWPCQCTLGARQAGTSAPTSQAQVRVAERHPQGGHQRSPGANHRTLRAGGLSETQSKAGGPSSAFHEMATFFRLAFVSRAAHRAARHSIALPARTHSITAAQRAFRSPQSTGDRGFFGVMSLAGFLDNLPSR